MSLQISVRFKAYTQVLSSESPTINISNHEPPQITGQLERAEMIRPASDHVFFREIGREREGKNLHAAQHTAPINYWRES